MVATPYSEIIDLTMMRLTNYELDILKTTSPTNFNTYMTGFMVSGLSNFNNCAQNLSDRNDTTMTFNITLTDAEKDILSLLTSIQVMEKEIFDIRQIRGMIQDNSTAKRASEANLLKEKTSLYNTWKEECDIKKARYGLLNQNWETLFSNE